MAISVDDIIAKLPHRPPFRFISRVESITPQVEGDAVWFVSGREAFFEGHFPDQPIVPGVLVGEALAQLAGLVAWTGATGKHTDLPRPLAATLAQLDLRFEHAVRPPAEIALHARVTRVLGHLAMCDVEATHESATVARGSLVLAASNDHTNDAS